MKERGDSDGALVARARRGDSAAFHALARRHYRATYAVALAIVGRPADAEDVCQDAWIRALEKLDTCRKPERFVFWLLQIVRNRARNHLDARRVRAAQPLDASREAARAAADTEDPHRNLARRDLRRRLVEALETISEIQREIVLLHDLEGWKHREIAENLGISEGMSRQHLFQARARLRESLGADDSGVLDHDG